MLGVRDTSLMNTWTSKELYTCTVYTHLLFQLIFYYHPVVHSCGNVVQPIVIILILSIVVTRHLVSRNCMETCQEYITGTVLEVHNIYMYSVYLTLNVLFICFHCHFRLVIGISIQLVLSVQSVPSNSVKEMTCVLQVL